MGEAVGLATPTASGDSLTEHLKTKGRTDMDYSTRRYQKTNPDAYPTPIPSGQDGLPFDQDAADVQAGPDVQANGQAASNGQQDGLAMAGADVAKPEADPFDLASLRLSQDFASAVGVKPTHQDGSGQETVERVVCPDPSRPGLSAPNGRLGAERGSGDLSCLPGSLAGAGGGNDVLSPVAGDSRSTGREFCSSGRSGSPGPTARSTIGADPRWTRPMRPSPDGSESRPT